MPSQPAAEGRHQRLAKRWSELVMVWKAIVVVSAAVVLVSCDDPDIGPLYPSDSVTETETSSPPTPSEPESTTTRPPPSPSPSPTPSPSPSPTPSPSPSPTPSPSPAAPENEEDIYYENCDEARADGAAPLYEGEPGYDEHLDRDGDGVACEPYFGNDPGGGNDDGSNGDSDAYYENCDEARADGAAPLYEGDPGYDEHLDRDGDGVACES